jgi:hypothetical protein
VNDNNNNNHNSGNIPDAETSLMMATTVNEPPPTTLLLPPRNNLSSQNASSDDDSLTELHEQFEDEPEEGDNDNNNIDGTMSRQRKKNKALPKTTPQRRAARRQRRKSAPKRRLDTTGYTGSTTHTAATTTVGGSGVGLPKLRMFKPGAAPPPPVVDDERSHWSSSDGDEDPTTMSSSPQPQGSGGGTNTSHQQWLSADDIEICQRLDEEYERALEEREVVYTARYNSVRQSACFSILFMLLYLSLGTMFFRRQANWTVEESILFSIYTITTVGCKFLFVCVQHMAVETPYTGTLLFLTQSHSHTHAYFNTTQHFFMNHPNRRSYECSENTGLSVVCYLFHFYWDRWNYINGGTNVSIHCTGG